MDLIHELKIKALSLASSEGGPAGEVAARAATYLDFLTQTTACPALPSCTQHRYPEATSGQLASSHDRTDPSSPGSQLSS